jgi:hypothetical protein
MKLDQSQIVVLEIELLLSGLVLKATAANASIVAKIKGANLVDDT